MGSRTYRFVEDSSSDFSRTEGFFEYFSECSRFLLTPSICSGRGPVFGRKTFQHLRGPSKEEKNTSAKSNVLLNECLQLITFVGCSALIETYTKSIKKKVISQICDSSLFGGRQSNIFDLFTLQLRDPIRDFAFRSLLTSARFLPCCRETSAFANIQIDWKETPKAHLLKTDLPRLKKEEVKIEVKDGRVLQISGKRNSDNEDKNDTWHRLERSSGKFLRSLGLPENVKMKEIKVTILENEVLTVTIPKEEVKQPDVRTVEISG
ncbi:17.3 kDa class I heat shock protein-like [Juglans microcarpa x Juglans regia]|uniref:17.3 kDa class I heat shock protein-like n=1 Tax=Juglans microcarpa x Juglans regia TaxID=2249226 RepID=UPI001B7DA9AA|nr:17.3 kDa class I heat shock protein-like [Juglans microcarpa x Juglans regia]